MPVYSENSAIPMHHRSRTRRICSLLLIVILAGLLAACAEESGPEEDRRFANDPVTEVPADEITEPAATHKPDGEIVEAPTATSPGAGDALVSAKGAPTTLAFVEAGDIRIVQNQGAITTTLIELNDSERVVDLATSRDGERIAALIRTEADALQSSSMVVRVFDRFGDVDSESDLSDWSTPSATPEPTLAHGLSTEGSLSWSFDGQHILASVGGVSLVDLGIDGTSREILISSRTGTLVDAAWSPDGTQIALHAIDASGTATVWVFTPFIDGDSFRQVIPPPADAANLGSVSAFDWQPQGHGLMYILAATAEDPGGQLYTLDLDSKERRVIATPGRGGPAAQIVQFSQSPDGTAVSYVIVSLVDEEWQYHSLWLRSTVTSAFFEIPTPLADGIGGTWWLGNGFAWTTPDDPASGLSFIIQGRAPINIPLPTGEDATPSASPVVEASPIAEGTPTAPSTVDLAASPTSATPVATPMASPTDD